MLRFFHILWISFSYIGQEVTSSTLPGFPAYTSNLNWNCDINYSHYFENIIDNQTNRYFKILDTYSNTCGKFYESETYRNASAEHSGEIGCFPSYLFYYCDLTEENIEKPPCRSSSYVETNYLENSKLSFFDCDEDPE